MRLEITLSYGQYTVQHNDSSNLGGARTSTGGGRVPPLPHAGYAPDCTFVHYDYCTVHQSI